MTLRQTIIDDAETVFCNTNDFAESVTYRNGLTGQSTSIVAVVMRDGYQADQHGNESEVFEVHIPVSEVSALTPAIDQLTFPKRVGETATAQTIVRLISHDEGMWIVECR